MKPAAPIGAALAGAVAAWLYTPDKSAAALEKKYLDSPADYREVAGIRLHLRDTGPSDAPAVILLHGFGSSLHTWQPWAERLSTDNRVIRYDLPGFGLTGPDPSGDYSDRRGIAILAALMDDLGIARASLVGNSMGGKLAWTFAEAHPDRVRRLVLIAPDGFASPGFDYGKAARIPPAVRLLPFVLPRLLLRSSLAPAYGDRGKLTRSLVTRYRDLMLAPGNRRAMIARMQQVMLEDPRPALRRIKAPTLLLWGEKDAMIPIAHAQDYLASLPNAMLVALPGLGHVLFEEAPAIALVPITSFLAGNP
ncbi:alpha/beta fold hydrolase [Lichenicoccus sp.]|uniref:alpha/beta fold hydrolase n=1 Tax=Lichenicoccus sp. TaxID=2781899 RepID=UPI003D1060B6